jgi:hypothetical protein
MSVAAILRVADVNDIHDYYHYINRPKFAYGYNDLSLVAIVVFYSSYFSLVTVLL